MMILCSPSSLKLNYVILRRRCKYIISLGIKVVHDLSIYPGRFVVDARIELQTVELVIVNDPLLIKRKLGLKKLQV